MQYPDLPFEPFFSWAIRPRVMYAPGLRKEVGFEMEQLGGKKVVIYTDKGLVGAGVAQMVIDAVKSSDLELVGVYDRILQDARIDIINDGARFYRETGADGLIAVGGGSVMDTAKAVNIMIGGGHDDFQPLADQAGLWEGAQPLPPHIAFPTTAGTGSEVTYAIVVLDIKAQSKLSVSHQIGRAHV
jgi:alcohol dehydrogenase class IV